MATRKDTFRSTQVEGLLDSLLGERNGKPRYRYVEAYPIEGIERRPDSQSRVTPVDTAHVRHLAEKMKVGETFAPLVLWETPDNGVVLIDGNHRALALTKAKRETTPAYVITADDNQEALVLSSAFNAQNGKPLTAQEIRRAVLAARAAGYVDAKIQAVYGFSRNTINDIFNEEHSINRAARLGLSIDGVTRTHLRRLAALSMDAAFRDCLRLVQQSQMSVADLNTLVKDLKALTSEEAQAARIQQERDARTDDIQAVMVGRRSSGTPFTELRTIVGTIGRVRQQYPSATDWVAKDATTVGAWLPQVEETVTFLEELLTAYRSAQVAA